MIKYHDKKEEMIYEGHQANLSPRTTSCEVINLRTLEICWHVVPLHQLPHHRMLISTHETLRL